MMSAQRVLVVHASQFGSTTEIAQHICSRLQAAGIKADLLPANKIQSLDGYDAIIIGGAIQYDKWISSARRFVNTFQTQLKSLPCICFFNCLTLSRRDHASLLQAQGYAQGIAKLFPSKPLSVQGFAGLLDYKRMNFATRVVAKIILSFFGVKQGDYRDWAAIDAWSVSVIDLLLANKKI